MSRNIFGNLVSFLGYFVSDDLIHQCDIIIVLVERLYITVLYITVKDFGSRLSHRYIDTVWRSVL